MQTQPGFTTRHQYRLKRQQSATLLIASTLLGSAAVYLIFFASKASSGGVLGLALPLAAVAAWLALVAIRSRMIIDGTQITICNGFITRSADLADIEGYRTIQLRNGTCTRLCLKNGNRAITLSYSFATDDDFRDWLEQLTNLDQRDRERILTEISQQQDLGATPQERLATLSTAKSSNVAIIVIAIASALFLNVADNIAVIQIPSAILLALVPLAVFMLVSRAPLLYAMFKRRSDPRTEISVPLIIAGLGFVFFNRAVHIVSMKPLEFLIAFIAIVYFAAFLRCILDSSSRFIAFLGVLFFALLYSVGMTITVNTLDDQSPATTYTAPVLRKHISSGRSTTYYLDLAPWGPIQNRNSLRVPRSTYDAFAVGEQVCLALHAGRLHAPWYAQVPCEVSPDNTR